MDPVYVRVRPGERLWQGEILTNVVERQAKWNGIDFDLSEIAHPFAVVASQDCDLEQEHRARTDGKPAVLTHVLLLAASDFEQGKAMFASSAIRTRAKQNKDERYQFLSAVKPADEHSGTGLPALILDFKRLWSYPYDELLRLIEVGEAQRHARLAATYLEHLSSRVSYFLGRVGLPLDHHDIVPDTGVVLLQAVATTALLEAAPDAPAPVSQPAETQPPTDVEPPPTDAPQTPRDKTDIAD